MSRVLGLVCYLFSFVPTAICSTRQLPHFIVVDINHHISPVALCLPCALQVRKALLKAYDAFLTCSAHGRHNGSAFILSCVRTLFCELPLRGRWQPEEQLSLYMHQKCNIGSTDTIFCLATMIRSDSYCLVCSLCQLDNKQEESRHDIILGVVFH